MIYYIIFHLLCSVEATFIWIKEFDELDLNTLIFTLFFGPIAALLWTVEFISNNSSFIIWKKKK